MSAYISSKIGPKACWSFRSNYSDFDGDRILREAREAGAEIVVVGRDGRGAILIHESLRKLGRQLGIDCPTGSTEVRMFIGSDDGKLYTMYGGPSEWFEMTGYSVANNDISEPIAKALAYQREVHAAHAHWSSFLACIKTPELY